MTKTDKRKIRYVELSWTDPEHGYRCANYPSDDIPGLLQWIKNRGVTVAYVDDEERAL